MRTLVFDTSGNGVVAALVNGSTIVGAESTELPAQHMLAVVSRLLDDAGATPASLDRIAVGVGPGSFTAVRIGIASARGMAAAGDLPVAGLPTLAAIAQPTAAASGEVVWAHADARRGERFLRSYRWISGVAGFSMVPQSDLLVVSEPQVATHIGDAPVSTGPVTPEGLVALLPTASFGAPDDVVPVYGREPDAVPAAG